MKNHKALFIIRGILVPRLIHANCKFFNATVRRMLKVKAMPKNWKVIVNYRWPVPVTRPLVYGEYKSFITKERRIKKRVDMMILDGIEKGILTP